MVLGHSAETGTERFKTVAKGALSKLRRMVNEVLCGLVGAPPHGLMRMFGSGRMERVLMKLMTACCLSMEFVCYL